MNHQGLFSGQPTLDVVTAHAGGDVGCVILGGVDDLPGGTVSERAEFLRREVDGLRRLLIQKPHGDPSQCVNLVVPPADPSADAGLIIMGTMGYPDFSGSNAMCTMAALLEAGRLPMDEGERRVVLETPGGSTGLRVTCRAGRLESVAYDALPGFVLEEQRRVTLEGRGEVPFSLVYGGAFYAVIAGMDIGLDPASASVSEISNFFEAFFAVAAPGLELRHPTGGHSGPLTLGLLVGALDGGPSTTSSVPVAAYMDPGVVCRSPTGTGTTALLAWLSGQGRVSAGATIRTISPFGSEFSGTLAGLTTVDGYTGVRTVIAGRPYLLAHGRIVVDTGDPLVGDYGLDRIIERAR